MLLSWQIVTFQLKETFSISYGNYSSREALIVSLSYKGVEGYGECTAIDYYGIKLPDFVNLLSSSKTLIEAQKIIYPTEFYQFILRLNFPSFLVSALDCAYWDLYGKLEGKNFIELNKIPIKNIPESSLTISAGPIETQLNKIKTSGWSKFKIKCKSFDEIAIQKLTELDKTIALDFNGSFTSKDCELLQNTPWVQKISYLEQPMPTNQFQILERDKFANWMADEDCQSIENLRSLQPHYQSINVKLVKCGGLTPALSLIEKAKALNFKIMIGCMTESTIGISAGAVLAPLADYTDLDGANLIANDIAKGSKIYYGNIQLSEKPGLGISVF
ncbi:enolase C-terminal domain-like protein [Flavobacterium luminosum]|uniref:Chloromuconate cycloisomerase n=1 Tax=Flavobacterium luminosum TaxID=2949086 RepID=A0ABT0TQ96_9FLAO|nr:enolase C-terminal domain-like protein [Flavobacterium sp. HXWNR70]MCL9809535.1 chloromuconate cycloisomerase [Flavobacterium sp. HXWNR70]